MAFIKYSIGSISEVQDKGEIKKFDGKEINNDYKIVICEKCGLQHMIIKNNSAVFCCDKEIKIN